jgi:hypothetical protein
MVGFRPAWFVHVDPDAAFPRYTKTTDPSGRAGAYVGPVEDKHAAGRLIELAENAFDLCRYYNISGRGPRGKACAYKEMGRCPAPCDGTVSMGGYRQLVAMSLRALVDPQPLVREQEQRMRQAAGELRFEAAGKIKQYVDLLGQLGKGAVPSRPTAGRVPVSRAPARAGRRHGQGIRRHAGRVEHAASLVGEPAAASSLLRVVFERGGRPTPAPLAREQVERIGVVSHNLFSGRPSRASSCRWRTSRTKAWPRRTAS